jgi:WD40 repeat protein
MKKRWLPTLSLVFAAAACTEQKAPAPAADAGKKAEEPRKVENPFKDWAPREIGRHQGGVTYVGIAPDGKTVVSCGRDKNVRLWSAEGQALHTLSGHSDEVAMAAFSPDGKTLASVSKDQSAILWEVASGKRLRVMKDKPPREKDMTEEQLKLYAATPPPFMNWAVFSADGARLVTAGDDFALKIWEVKSGKKLSVIQDTGCRQRSVYRRLDSPGWISASACLDDGVTYLKFWDESGNLTGQEGDAEHDAHYLAFDPLGRWIVAGDGSLMLTVFSSQGSQLQRVLAGGYHFSLAFGRRGQNLAVGQDAGRIDVYEPQVWKRRGTISTGRAAAVDSLAVNPADGSLWVASRDGALLRFERELE